MGDSRLEALNYAYVQRGKEGREGRRKQGRRRWKETEWKEGIMEETMSKNGENTGRVKVISEKKNKKAKFNIKAEGKMTKRKRK